MSVMILRQLLNFVISLFVLTLFTFGLTHLFPEDTAFIISQNLQPNSLVKIEDVVSDGSHFFSEYIQYINQIYQGNLGFSSVRGTSVFKEFFIYFPATLELSLAALIFATFAGIPLGIIAAKNKNKWPDKLIVSSTLFGYSMPIFWWAMLLILFFSLWLGVTPVASRLGFEFDIHPITGFMLIDTLLSNKSYSIEAFYSALHHLLLPAVVLGTIPLAVVTRSTRSAMISILTEDYIRSAKARGLSLTNVIWKHALRNAMIPIVTTIGLLISILITGSLITESIFSWPGTGKWLLEAVYRRDFTVIHGAILTIAGFIILVHFILDLLSIYLDPKRRRT